MPDDEILDLSKLKAIADDKTNTTEIVKNVLERVEKILWERYKIMVKRVFCSIFFYSIFFFKSLRHRVIKPGKFGKGQTLYHTITTFNDPE